MYWSAELKKKYTTQERKEGETEHRPTQWLRSLINLLFFILQNSRNENYPVLMRGP